MEVLFVLGGIFLVVSILLARIQFKYRFKFGVPGPPPHFLLGNSHALRDEFGPFSRHRMIDEYHKRYGLTFVTHLPFAYRALIFTRDPALTKAMLKNMDDFPVRGDPNFGLPKLIPQGLFGVIQGEQWKMHRRALSPLFSERYLRWYNTAVNEHLGELQAFLREQIGNQLDMHSALTSFTLDVIGHIGFGSRFNTLRNPNSPFVTAGKDMLSAVVAVSPFRFFNDDIDRKGVAGKVTFDKVTDSILDRTESELDNDEAKLNMLRAMQDAVDPQSGHKLSREEIRDEIISLLAAGHETTANTATWALHLLATHPDIFARVRKEIDDVTQKDSSLAPGLFEFDQLHALTFTKRVVFETLRLFPTVPAFPRRAARDLELKQSDGSMLYLPKHSMIFASTVQFLPGDLRDPASFYPDRFDPSSPAYDPAVEDKIKFLPFGGGGRVCLGQRFAEMESVQMLAALIAQFDFASDPKRPPKEYCDITLGPKESGLWMRVDARQ